MAFGDGPHWEQEADQRLKGIWSAGRKTAYIERVLSDLRGKKIISWLLVAAMLGSMTVEPAAQGVGSSVLAKGMAEEQIGNEDAAVPAAAEDTESKSGTETDSKVASAAEGSGTAGTAETPDKGAEASGKGTEASDRAAGTAGAALVQPAVGEAGTVQAAADAANAEESKPATETAGTETVQPVTETLSTEMTQPATPGTEAVQPVTETPGIEVIQPVTEITGTEAATQQPATEQGTTEGQTDAKSDIALSGLSPAKARVIVLDPGHCDKHPGASGNGLHEEAVVLDIAKACRDYLEDYADVIVYMTREDGSCPSENGLGDDLLSRNNIAKRLDADFLVSMHINAASRSSANGANVLTAYKSGYHDSIRIQTQAFGKIALAKLKALGIRDDGLLLRRSENGTRYSNGALSDYYSIVRHGVLLELPSVIIEHGFITNSSEAHKYFRTKAQRQKLGKTDAKAILEYYNLGTKTVQGSLKTEKGNTYFINGDKKKVGGWVKHEGDWYYFDETTGAQKKGFVKAGENLFYLNPSNGKMVTGWFTVDGKRYLAKGNGTLVTSASHSDGLHKYLFDNRGRQLKKGFYSLDGFTYYVNSKKYVVTGISKIKGKYYAFEGEGRMLFGLHRLNGGTYYLDEKTGVMARKKIVKTEDGTFYFGKKGTRETGWVSYKSGKYYFDKSSGKMAEGWTKLNGKYYYFSPETGKMQKSKWIGKYYVNSKGVRTKKK